MVLRVKPGWMIESGDSMEMKMIYKVIINHVGVVKVFTSV